MKSLNVNSIFKINLSFKQKWLLSLFFFFSFSLTSYAQSETQSLFTVVEKHNDLSDIATQRLEKINEDRYNKSVHFVEIGDLGSLIEHGYLLKFKLPNNNTEFYAEAVTVNSEKEGDYYWYGTVYNGANEVGTISLTAINGSIVGQVIMDDASYTLKDLDKGKNVLVEMDKTIQSTKGCGMEGDHSGHDHEMEQKDNSKGETIEINTKVCDRIVRVLVLHTTNANVAGNPQADATRFINETNQILRNSGIPASQLQFQLAGLEAYNFPTFNPANGNPTGNVNGNETTNSLSDITTLQADGQSPGTNLFGWRRTTHDADLVVLLTGAYPGVFGRVFSLDNGAQNAYGIVAINSPAARFTFSHEVAHLFGCAHNNSNTTLIPDPNARGHRFRTGWWIFGTWRRTIMTAATANQDRIQHYSNPNVDFIKEPTGTNTRNNAARLVSRACAVSDYDPNNTAPAPVVNIHGTTIATNTSVNTWTTSVSNCTPVSYSWELSSDGINFFNMSNVTGSSYTGSIFAFAQFTFFRVTVTCSNGQTDTDVHVVRNRDFNRFLHPFMVDPNSENVTTVNEADLVSPNNNNNVGNNGFSELMDRNELAMKVFPNPVRENLTIETFLPEEGLTTIHIYDMLGKEVAQIYRGTTTLGLRQFNFNVTNLNTGIYTVVIRQNATFKTQLISVNK